MGEVGANLIQIRGIEMMKKPLNGEAAWAGTKREGTVRLSEHT
jgi:hypothetical protein